MADEVEDAAPPPAPADATPAVAAPATAPADAALAAVAPAPAERPTRIFHLKDLNLQLTPEDEMVIAFVGLFPKGMEVHIATMFGAEFKPTLTGNFGKHLRDLLPIPQVLKALKEEPLPDVVLDLADNLKHGDLLTPGSVQAMFVLAEEGKAGPRSMEVLKTACVKTTSFLLRNEVTAENNKTLLDSFLFSAKLDDAQLLKSQASTRLIEAVKAGDAKARKAVLEDHRDSMKAIHDSFAVSASAETVLAQAVDGGGGSMTAGGSTALGGTGNAVVDAVMGVFAHPAARNVGFIEASGHAGQNGAPPSIKVKGPMKPDDRDGVRDYGGGAQKKPRTG